MIITYKDGRQIEVDITGSRDDIQINSANWIDQVHDGGNDVGDEVIDWIYDNCSEQLDEAWLDKQISAIDFMEDYNE